MTRLTRFALVVRDLTHTIRQGHCKLMLNTCLPEGVSILSSEERLVRSLRACWLPNSLVVQLPEYVKIAADENTKTIPAAWGSIRTTTICLLCVSSGLYTPANSDICSLSNFVYGVAPNDKAFVADLLPSL